jgi:hypothetical protein
MARSSISRRARLSAQAVYEASTLRFTEDDEDGLIIEESEIEIEDDVASGRGGEACTSVPEESNSRLEEGIQREVHSGLSLDGQQGSAANSNLPGADALSSESNSDLHETEHDTQERQEYLNECVRPDDAAEAEVNAVPGYYRPSLRAITLQFRWVERSQEITLLALDQQERLAATLRCHSVHNKAVRRRYRLQEPACKPSTHRFHTVY